MTEKAEKQNVPPRPDPGTGKDCAQLRVHLNVLINAMIVQCQRQCQCQDGGMC
jgi:hypothetical protein